MDSECIPQGSLTLLRKLAETEELHLDLLHDDIDCKMSRSFTNVTNVSRQLILTISTLKKKKKNFLFLWPKSSSVDCRRCDDDAKNKSLYLMWSYFLKRALYSTALCWSSTSMLLPYIETTFLIRLKWHFKKCSRLARKKRREKTPSNWNGWVEERRERSALT